MFKKKYLRYLLFCFMLLILIKFSFIDDIKLLSKKREIIHKFNSNDVINQTRVFKKTENSVDLPFEVFYQSINIPNGGELGGVTSYGSTLYYIIDYRDPMSNFTQVTDIYAYNWNEDKEEKIYTIDDDSIILVNELQADGNNLYWSIFDGKKYDLVKFCLNTKSLSFIYSASFEQIPIILGEKGNHLSWYMKDKLQKKYNLIMYDLYEESLSTIKLDEKTLRVQPYDRPSLSESEILFLQEEDKDIIFSILDTNVQKSKNIFKISDDLSSYYRPQISKSKIVWTSSAGKEIYYYDRYDNTLSFLDISFFNTSIFSMNLSEDFLFIVNRYSDIVCFDLENKIYFDFSIDTFKRNQYNIKKEFPEEWYYGYSRFTRDGKILSEVLLNKENEAVICIIEL